MIDWLIPAALLAGYLFSARFITRKFREMIFAEFGGTEDSEDKFFAALIGFLLALIWPLAMPFFALYPFIIGAETSFERNARLKAREEELKRREKEVRDWSPPSA